MSCGARTLRGGGRLGNEAAGAQPSLWRRGASHRWTDCCQASTVASARACRPQRRPSRVAKPARTDSFCVRVLGVEVQESCRVARGLRCTRRWLKFKTNNTLNFKRKMTMRRVLSQVLCSACASSPDAAAQRQEYKLGPAVRAQPRPQRSVVARQTALTKKTAIWGCTAPYGLIV